MTSGFPEPVESGDDAIGKLSKFPLCALRVLRGESPRRTTKSNLPAMPGSAPMLTRSRIRIDCFPDQRSCRSPSPAPAGSCGPGNLSPAFSRQP
jgi:hypothetical protein